MIIRLLCIMLIIFESTTANADGWLPSNFNIGALNIQVHDDQIYYKWHDKTIASNEIQAGGRFVPYPYVDATGSVALGNAYFDNQNKIERVYDFDRNHSFLIGKNLKIVAGAQKNAFMIVTADQGKKINCKVKINDWKHVHVGGGESLFKVDPSVKTVFPRN